MSAQSDRETIAELREALASTTSELATMKVRFGDAAQEKAQRARAQQGVNNALIVETSQKELDNFDRSVAATLDSLKAVTTNSTLELNAGYVSSRPEAVVETRRLSGQLGDLLLARDRKRHQHEALVSRLGHTIISEQPRKPTSFEPEYYAPSSEGEPDAA